MAATARFLCALLLPCLTAAVLLLLAESTGAADATTTRPRQDAGGSDVPGERRGEAKFLYFAYGSNLLARRLHLMNPTARRHSIGQLKVGSPQRSWCLVWRTHAHSASPFPGLQARLQHARVQAVGRRPRHRGA